MTTNKEIIDKLCAYYKEQADFETLARALANCLVDIHRILNWSGLPKEEQECLWARMKKSDEMLTEFVKTGKGSDKKFRLVNVQRAEDIKDEEI